MIRSWDECLSNEVPTLKCLEVVLNNLLVISSALIILALFIMLVVGSLRYLTSGGNPEKLKKAQSVLKWAIIGVVIYLGAFLALKIIDVLFLGGQGAIFKLDFEKLNPP